MDSAFQLVTSGAIQLHGRLQVFVRLAGLLAPRENQVAKQKCETSSCKNGKCLLPIIPHM